MIKKYDILKMAKDVARYHEGHQPRRLFYPARAWGVVVLVTFLTLIAVGMMANQWYGSLQNVAERVETSPIKVVRYDAATVEQALLLLTDRQEQFITSTKVPESEPLELETTGQ